MDMFQELHDCMMNSSTLTDKQQSQKSHTHKLKFKKKMCFERNQKLSLEKAALQLICCIKCINSQIVKLENTSVLPEIVLNIVYTNSRHTNRSSHGTKFVDRYFLIS